MTDQQPPSDPQSEPKDGDADPRQLISLQKAINDSGFPFQLGVKMLASQSPRWRHVLTEHPWHDSTDHQDKFIDLVISDKVPFVHLVIECKRARDTNWMFLRESVSSEHSNDRLNVEARITAKRQNGSETNDWIDMPFVPGSPVAEFCVVKKNGKRDQTLLESTAAELLRSVGALAHQEYILHSRDWPPIRRIYVPVIVSNAAMYICDADWQKLEFKSGEVEFSSIEPVAFLRFRKNFGATTVTPGAAADLTILSDRSARSVVVVQANSLMDFLSKFQLGNAPAHVMELFI